MGLNILKINLIIILILIVVSIDAQDLPLSQYYNNLPLLNPAFVGTAHSNRINIFYRNQWPQADYNFLNYGVGYDQSIVKYNSGVGVFLQNEVNGVVQSPSVKLAYAYHIKIYTKLNISMALQAGVAQKYINQSTLVFEDEITSGTTSENLNSGLNKTYSDFALGVISFYQSFFGGVSVDHLTKPRTGTEENSNRINQKITFHVGYVFENNKTKLSDQRSIMPNIMYQVQGSQQNLTWGCLYQYNNIIGGLLMRNNIKQSIDVLIFSLGIKTPKLRISYSYDMNIGKKTTMPLGAHEILLTLLFENHTKKKYKAINCPSFLE